MQEMGAEIPEGAAALDGRIGHPAVIRIEPAAERTVVAVHVAHAGDPAEHTVIHHLLQRLMHGRSAHEVAGLEQHARFADRIGHGERIRGGKS